jgi:Ala-tRNA(Pro) deacylase
MRAPGNGYGWLASESVFASDCEGGAMSPFGNLYERPRVRRPGLGRNERIVFQAGTHSVTMSIAYADFERLAGLTVADVPVTRSV